MPTLYRVLQYVPDTVADERINIGVVAYDETSAATAVIGDNVWPRVKCFSEGNIASVREFAARFAQTSDRSQIDRWAEQLDYCLRLSPPRPTTKPADAAIVYLQQTLLRQRQELAPTFRDRSAARAVVRSGVREAVSRRFSPTETEHLLRSRSIPGDRVKKHTFDVTVGNGAPFLAATAMSFEVPSMHRMEGLRDQTAFHIIDVKDAMPDLPIGVLILPPAEGALPAVKEEYATTSDLMRRIGATLITEQSIGNWTAAILAKHPYLQHPA